MKDANELSTSALDALDGVAAEIGRVMELLEAAWRLPGFDWDRYHEGVRRLDRACQDVMSQFP